MSNISHILCSLLILFSSSRIYCADNMTDASDRDKGTRIASTLIRMGERMKSPLIQLLGKSFDRLENKFDDVENLVEDANIEQQMTEIDRIETRLENEINATERRLEKLITDKFMKLANDICKIYTCSEWSEWTDCDVENQFDYGLRNRTRECGKKASFCSETTEPKSETESVMCQFLCPSNYTVTPSKYCVRLYMSITLTREDAELHCQKDGGHLVNIDSASKSDDVTAILKKENPGRVWIDGIRKSRNENWEFSYGSVSAKYTNWKFDQPNEYIYPNCMYILPSEWLWADYPCSHSYNFMCEIR